MYVYDLQESTNPYNAQEIGNRIYQEKIMNDSNSKDLARCLNVLSKTVFGDVNRLVFVLLQNADDSSIEKKNIGDNKLL